MQKAPESLAALVRGVVEPMGYELVGVLYRAGQPAGGLLRIYIDREGGIQLDDCVAVSQQLSGVLDVEDPIKGEYQLEVSSPGLDRPLFEPAHYQRFAGHEVQIRLSRAMDRRRRFKGRIVALDGSDLVLDVEGEELRLPLDLIDSARLVPEF